jgi:hypothetical protein
MELIFGLFFLMVYFLGVNHKLMTDELSIIKKNCYYSEGSKGNCE